MTIVNGKKEGPATIYDWNKDLKMEVIYENSLYNGPFTVYTDLSKEILFKTCSGFPKKEINSHLVLNGLGSS
jgi:antitoxin component YwqK of YwqJK toxin-antitoxin module